MTEVERATRRRTILPARRAMATVVIPIVAAMAVLTACGNAGAAIWGYIDDQGVAHFATEQTDPRYQLYFKGRSDLDPPDAAAAAQEKALADFRESPIFKRISNQPNAKRYAGLIAQSAVTMQLDPALVKAVVAVESGFNATAVSGKGAVGLMQLIPDTAARYGIETDRRLTAEQKLLDPATNLRVGARYLRDLINLFAGDLSLALAAYNAGEQAVIQYGNRIPPFPETQEFVKLVQQFRAVFTPPPTRTPQRLRLRVRGAHPAAAATGRAADSSLGGAPAQLP